MNLVLSAFCGMVGVSRLLRLGGGLRHDLDHAHHAAVLVFEEMAMVEEGADDFGIAEVHA